MFTLLASAFAAAAANPGFKTGELNVYIQKTSKNNVNVLKLYPNNTYNYCRYTKYRVARDTGSYQIRGCKLKLKSCLKRKGSNPFLKETGFIGKHGIYKDRLPRTFAVKPDFSLNKEEKYLAVWNYNPVTRNFYIQNADNSDHSGTSSHISEKFSQTKLSELSSIAKSFYIAKANFYSDYGLQLKKAYTGPDDYLVYEGGRRKTWNGDTSNDALMKSFKFVIHESVHHYNSNNKMLVIPGIEIELEQHAIFRSADFAGIVPDELEQSIFRYKDYVSDTSTVSANVSGIYGLLDEYSAYMNGTRFSLLAAEKSLTLGNAQDAIFHIQDASMVYYAYYEFRLFIAWYLEYAEKYNKSVYQNMMNHRNMRVLFTLLDNEYLETIKGFEKLTFPNNEYSWAKASSPYESIYVKPCKTALALQEERLNNFKIEGVNKLNYKEFVQELNTP